MNCTNCKNPISENHLECEWCGHKLLQNLRPLNKISYEKSYTPLVNNSYEKSNKKFNFLFLSPGIVVFLIWVTGNIMSESEKQRLFGQDDISGWLIASILFIVFGFILGLFNKK